MEKSSFNLNDWVFVYSEANSLIVNDIFFYGFTEYKDVPGMFRELIYVNQGGVHVCSAPSSEIRRIREEGVVFLNKEYRQEFKNKILQCVEKFESVYNTFLKCDIKKASNTELLSIFEKYVERLKEMFAYYQVSGGRCYPILEEYMKGKLKEYLDKDDVNLEYGLLLKNTEPDILERESLELMVLSEDISVSDRVLIEHSIKYPLLFINMYDREKIIYFLRERMNDYREKKCRAKLFEKTLLMGKESIKKSQKEIVKKFKSDSDLIDSITYLREQGRLRFEYKNWKNGAEYKFLELFEEIANRVDVPTEEFLLSYLVNDTKDFLIRGDLVPKSEAKNRKKLSVFYQSRSGKVFKSGEVAKDLANSVLKRGNLEEKALKGVVANRGKAIGRAHIILPTGWDNLQKEIKSFKKGEILITTMTEPNLILIMKKAAAIVTNQGGITSHAAVVARELNIPCVIGTLRATDIFKTGDMVEVDAEKGLVTLIKQ